MPEVKTEEKPFIVALACVKAKAGDHTLTALRTETGNYVVADVFVPSHGAHAVPATGSVGAPSDEVFIERLRSLIKAGKVPNMFGPADLLGWALEEVLSVETKAYDAAVTKLQGKGFVFATPILTTPALAMAPDPRLKFAWGPVQNGEGAVLENAFTMRTGPLHGVVRSDDKGNWKATIFDERDEKEKWATVKRTRIDACWETEMEIVKRVIAEA